jgi:hypothetical protein
MSRRGKLSLIAALLLVALTSVSAQSVSAQNNTEADVEVFIRFYNKKIFYLNKTEDIVIKVSIINRSLEPFRFRLADNKVFNLDFEVKTPGNVPLAHARSFTIDRASEQYVYFKEIELKPEEEYSFIVYLDRFTAFEQAGAFTVQALFYPELLRNNRRGSLRSNILTLNLRPKILLQEQREMIEEETGRVIQKEVLPPDEVVEFTIRARQKSQWERFKLYLDLRSLMLDNEEWRIRYDKLSEDDRLKLIDEYEGQLREEQVDEDILVIPQEFEIQRTVYTPYLAEVTVLKKFQYPGYVENKLYTYFLRREQDPYWMITSFSVQNLGTE